MPRTLRLILGDQLTHTLPMIQEADPQRDLFILVEVREEVAHVKYHIKKVAFIFSAMRHFAEELQKRGFKIRYTRISDPRNTNCLLGEITRAIRDSNFDLVCVTEPSEYRLAEEFKAWQQRLALPVEIYPDDRFYCSTQQFQDWAADKKSLQMDHLYREMRTQHNILMEDGKPIGGKWSFDSNKGNLPKNKGHIPKPIQHSPDGVTKQVIRDVNLHFSTHFGELEPFHLAVCAAQAQWALSDFIESRLSKFKDHQEIMLQGEPWLYHSYISAYLNCGLLTPKEVIGAVLKAYKRQRVTLSAVEGFIKQILGWREFVRGMYWLNMPQYTLENYLEAKLSLPTFYWHAETKMNCMQQCVSDSKQYAYTHNIQRLMVLGNFALLAGIRPQEVNKWFWIVYADAFEWVELPNVSGLALFADGGKLTDKPHAYSGTDINKKSNYCQQCQYKVKEEQGPDACPFNYLYWHFLIKHQDKFKEDAGMNTPYKALEDMDAEKQKVVVQDAKSFLEKMGKGERV